MRVRVRVRKHPSRIGNENGAVAVIVAILLVALVGATALAVDAGALMAKRRVMVRAADSAALAYAQACVSLDPASAPIKADETATANELNATTVATYPRVVGVCDRVGTGGNVTVAYEVSQDAFFGPVVGMDEQNQVRARAVASWGIAGGGANVVPIMLDSARIGDPVECDFPEPEAGIGTRCVLWYDSDIASGQWALMNLDQWNVDPAENCSSAGTSDRREWIEGGYPGLLTLGDPPPTYTCADSGHATPQWLTSLESRTGDILLFPVNDPAQQLVVSGHVDKYAIVGFTALKMIRVSKGNDPGVTDTTTTTTTTGSCRNKTYDFTLNATLDLVAFGEAQGCVTVTPDAITNVELSKGNGQDRVVYTPCAIGQTSGCDYSYDSANRVVTWVKDTAVAGVNVGFDWSQTTTTVTPGMCGTPPDSTPSNALCLITEWQGYQTTPGPVGGGIDFGVRSVQLTE